MATEYRQPRFARPPGATEILLVRHGESRAATEDDPFPLVDGHGDPELHPAGRQQAERVGERLRNVFSPVFEGPPAAVVRSRGRTHLAFMELPVKGWRPGYFASDGNSWALAGDYPLNARTVLASRGVGLLLGKAHRGRSSQRRGPDRQAAGDARAG